MHYFNYVYSRHIILLGQIIKAVKPIAVRRKWAGRSHKSARRKWARRFHTTARRKWSRRSHMTTRRKWARRSHKTASRKWARRSHTTARRKWARRSHMTTRRKWARRSHKTASRKWARMAHTTVRRKWVRRSHTIARLYVAIIAGDTGTTRCPAIEGWLAVYLQHQHSYITQDHRCDSPIGEYYIQYTACYNTSLLFIGIRLHLPPIYK